MAKPITTHLSLITAKKSWTKQGIALFCLALLCLFSCQQKQQGTNGGTNGAFAKAPQGSAPNVERIVNSGELIVGTISGPDTYFDYQGTGMGLQYALAEDFAETLGVGVRVELSNDTLQLVNMLKKGEIDVIALQIPKSFIEGQDIVAAGATDKEGKNSWAIKPEVDDLAEALDDWFGDGVEVNVQKKEERRMRERTIVRRKVHAPFISREKGIISTYDGLFKEAAAQTGWDWRLIAAQCYQESAFDPNAVSGAGASGLMQLMPKTAAQFGLSQDYIFDPKQNVRTAAMVIRNLQSRLSDIRDGNERIKFILASYNGGLGHIKDAQALTQKYGGDPQRWDDVSQYVRRLSEARYYRDPVVKHGYMIGSETAGYVEGIFSRWEQYGGDVRSAGRTPSSFRPSAPTSGQGQGGKRITPHKSNRYSKERTILSPEEMAKQKQ